MTLARTDSGAAKLLDGLSASRRPLAILIIATSICFQLLDVGFNVSDVVQTSHASAGDLVSVADFLVGVAVAVLLRRL
jgi:hypothetical protein